jgi:uncharacterized phage-associated protein
MATTPELKLAAVANSFLVLAAEDNINDVSNMKLQKLVYFAYRDFLCDHGTPMFDEQFEKWTWGPVLPSLYQYFKKFGNNPIDEFIMSEDGTYKMIDMDRNVDYALPIFSTWEKYKLKPAMELSAITHQPTTAWSKAKSGEPLNKEDIKTECQDVQKS